MNTWISPIFFFFLCFCFVFPRCCFGHIFFRGLFLVLLLTCFFFFVGLLVCSVIFPSPIQLECFFFSFRLWMPCVTCLYHVVFIIRLIFSQFIFLLIAHKIVWNIINALFLLLLGVFILIICRRCDYAVTFI